MSSSTPRFPSTATPTAHRPHLFDACRPRSTYRRIRTFLTANSTDQNSHTLAFVILYNTKTRNRKSSSHGERTRRARRPVSAINPHIPSYMPCPSCEQRNSPFPLMILAKTFGIAPSIHHPKERSTDSVLPNEQLRPPQMLCDEPHHQSERPRLGADFGRQSRRERAIHWREPGVCAVWIRARHGRERR